MIIQEPFYFIRHGQTDWNSRHSAMGVTDIALNENGKRQSLQAIEQLKDLPITTICHSPLKRATETAEILNQSLHCPLVAIEELKEFNLGSYAGTTIGTWFDDWMNDSLILPKGETFKEFVTRSLLGVNKALSHKGPVLIVAHGGTYWSIQRAIQLLDLPDLPNCILASFSPPKENTHWNCKHAAQGVKTNE